MLQILLSRTERKWLGLILPVISFLFGFLYPFNIYVFWPAVILVFAGFILAVIGYFSKGNKEKQ